jgi:hypothetical protein
MANRSHAPAEGEPPNPKKEEILFYDSLRVLEKAGGKKKDFLLPIL